MPAESKALTNAEGFDPREAAFIAEYPKDKNGTRAAQRAGYSPKNAKAAGIQASRMLAKPSIQQAIKRQLEQAAMLANVNTSRVLEELARIAFADIRQIYGERNELIDIRQLDDAAAAAISGVEVEEMFESDGAGGRIHVGNVVKIKRFNKQPALEALAEHLDIFKGRKASAPVVLNLNFGNQQINIEGGKKRGKK